MLQCCLHSWSISYFNVIAHYLAEWLPERQPHRAIKTTAARNKLGKKLASHWIQTCSLWIAGPIVCYNIEISGYVKHHCNITIKPNDQLKLI